MADRYATVVMSASVDLRDLEDGIKELSKELSEAMIKTNRETGDVVKRYYRIATQSWSEGSKPDIQVSSIGRFVLGNAATISTTFSTTSTPFIYVDLGTGKFRPGGKPYPIVPVRAKALRFQTGYKAKTSLGSAIGSLPGGPFGPTRYSKGVIHPGIKPRNITEKIVPIVRREHTTIFERNVARAIRRAW